MVSIKQEMEEKAKRVVEKLKAHHFKAVYFKTKEEATQEILKHVVPDQKIGFGGSQTILQLGILETLENRGQTVYYHWKPGLTPEQALETRKLEMTADLFLCSTNAVTLVGELVNIDGIGNRVNAMTFGPAKVILVAGVNKIVKDVQEGIKRIKNIAAPLNAKRLNMEVPCAKTGKCMDCSAARRICNILVVHERRPTMTDVLVILVGEELGY